MSKWVVFTAVAAVLAVAFGCAQPSVTPARDEDNTYAVAPASTIVKAR